MTLASGSILDERELSGPFLVIAFAAKQGGWHFPVRRSVVELGELTRVLRRASGGSNVHGNG